MTKEAEDFKRFAALEGLQPSDLGRRFVIGGNTYEICGYKPRCYKNPIIAKDVRTNRTFKFPTNTVRFHLGLPIRQTIGT